MFQNLITKSCDRQMSKFVKIYQNCHKLLELYDNTQKQLIPSKLVKIA